MKEIDILTNVGNAMWLPGRFGTLYGWIQLKARLDALERAVNEDDRGPVPLDFVALRMGCTRD